MDRMLGLTPNFFFRGVKAVPTVRGGGEMRQGGFLSNSAIEYREVVGLLRLRERQSVGRVI